MKTLAIIGAGNVGKALGRLWSLNESFTIGDVMTRTPRTAQEAVDFIGEGNPITDFAAVKGSDLFLLAVPDDQIARCCDALAKTGILAKGNIVFHCSGALASTVLEPARLLGASVASVHPIRSFASPAHVVKHFPGTYCGSEGSDDAMGVLQKAFADIGAECVRIDAESKIIYHAAAVFASNYVVTLMDVAQQAYIKSGIADDTALQLMAPLIRETVENVLRSGSAKALTGPIARGDLQTVEKQAQALTAWDENYGALYRQFAALTIPIAQRKRGDGP